MREWLGTGYISPSLNKILDSTCNKVLHANESFRTLSLTPQLHVGIQTIYKFVFYV